VSNVCVSALCAAAAAAASACRLGAGVKVINCVMMDDVSVGDGSHLQNCVICRGAVVQERATLKDCQVGDEGPGGGARGYTTAAIFSAQ
jgi:translation initiation factor eIF-2B subunit gamma